MEMVNGSSVVELVSFLGNDMENVEEKRWMKHVPLRSTRCPHNFFFSDSLTSFSPSRNTAKMKLAIFASILASAAAFAPSSVSTGFLSQDGH